MHSIIKASKQLINAERRETEMYLFYTLFIRPFLFLFKYVMFAPLIAIIKLLKKA